MFKNFHRANPMRIDNNIVNHKTKDLSMNMMKIIIMIMKGKSKQYQYIQQ